ncbi:uncharacterized protein GLRG_00076 [Colletotrichum graminicola M1.001]|uniref:Uncharacterized protein n=1 Tax=Colletotrichum graminicola (strain M1.001 / M2 / FGSC 10212) TaxID=645133 RepID=E3Q2V3_COLGM|nr:uncharacterized protein GLRG_00076 [Colletotrichum graminicola M1.001]EFQ24932.1 hypothetical protein GLRG_00076 [Colletotrichum graminicola M1.001]
MGRDGYGRRCLPQGRGGTKNFIFCEIMRGANVRAPVYMFGTKGNNSHAGDAGLDGRLNDFNFCRAAVTLQMTMQGEMGRNAGERARE